MVSGTATTPTLILPMVEEVVDAEDFVGSLVIYKAEKPVTRIELLSSASKPPDHIMLSMCKNGKRPCEVVYRLWKLTICMSVALFWNVSPLTRTDTLKQPPTPSWSATHARQYNKGLLGGMVLAFWRHFRLWASLWRARIKHRSISTLPIKKHLTAVRNITIFALIAAVNPSIWAHILRQIALKCACTCSKSQNSEEQNPIENRCHASRGSGSHRPSGHILRRCGG